MLSFQIGTLFLVHFCQQLLFSVVFYVTVKLTLPVTLSEGWHNRQMRKDNKYYTAVVYPCVSFEYSKPFERHIAESTISTDKEDIACNLGHLVQKFKNFSLRIITRIISNSFSLF